MEQRYEYFNNQVKVLEGQLELWTGVWEEDMKEGNYSMEEKESCLRKIVVLKELIEHSKFMRDNP
jgi:hypothetical protein